MTADALKPCPCGSTQTYAVCCGRWHTEHATSGKLTAPAPEALMRSRYSAFVLDLRPYLLASLLDAEALGPAEESGLVTVADNGGVRFSHPLVASAVYESASAGRRRRVHRTLAERVADPEEHARHLALAATGPDELGPARRAADPRDGARRRRHARGRHRA